MKLSELKSFNSSVWFLIFGTVICKASYFISMPFLAIRLKSALDLSPVWIGITLGVGPAVGVLSGFYVGHLSDLWGRRTLFAGSIFLWALTFFGFGLAHQFWQFALLNTLNGICNAANHPLSAAFISDLTAQTERKAAFHLRYFAINVGAACGPVLGAWLLLRNPSLGFELAAVVYLLYGFACLIKLPADSRTVPTHSTQGTFREVLRALSEDRPLFFYSLAFVLMGLTYSQLDSTLPQHLQAVAGQDGIKTFGFLMAANAATVVLFQIPMTRLTSGLSLLRIVQIGTGIYSLGLSLLGLAQGRAALGISMMILTLGEILVFSNGNLLIDRIAPESKKGAYFGASGLWALGPTLGPALGGYLLMRAGGGVLFFTASAVALANIWVYRLGHRSESARLNDPGRVFGELVLE